MLKLFFIAACPLLFAWITETNGCTGGVLRLEGSESRLEVCVEDQWISVCGNGWTSSAGNAACRQLGYESVSSHQTTPTTSVNGILFHRLNCSGSETSLLQCSDRLSLTSNCNMTLLECNQTLSDVECSTGDVRLLNEEGVPNAGIVSLCVGNHWTNITDDTWSNNDAMVVCKMLNYQSGSVGSDYEPGSGGSSDDSVKCDGSELSIYQCIVSLDAAVNNNLAQEASVLCQIGGGFENGAVRLYRNGVHSSQYYFGIVQLQYNGATGNICDDLNYGHNEADVICHQLGYAGASSHSRAGLMSYGIDNSPTLLDDVHCSSPDYLTILQCSYSTSIDSGCSSNSNDVIVHCYVTRIWDSSPFRGMIRLQNGSYSNEGRIEVYCNGQWGSICSAGFSSSTANTVCRQLGYSGHNGYNHLKFVSSPDIVWFNGITSEGISNCITSIASCPSQPVTNCNEGATVECIIREFDKVTNQINTCNETRLVTITPSQTVQTSTSSLTTTTEHTSTTTSTTNTTPTVGGTDLPFYRESLFLYTGAGVTVFIIFLLCIICCCCCCHCYCRRKKSIPYNARHSQLITQQTSTITSGTSDDLCIVRNPMAEDMVDNTDPSIAPSSPSVAPPPAPPLASVPPPPPPPPPPPAVGSAHTMPHRRSTSLPNHESMLNGTPIASPPPSAPPPPPLPSTPPSAPPPPSATRTFPRKVSAPPSLSPIPALRHPVTSTRPPPPNMSTDQYFNSLPSRKSNPTTPQHVASGPAPPPAPPPPPIPATNSMDRRLSQPARPIGSVQQQQQFQTPARLRHYSSTQPDPIPSGQAMRGPPPNNYPAQYFERRVSFNN